MAKEKIYHIKVELQTYVRAKSRKRAVKMVEKELPKLSESPFHYLSIEPKKVF